MTSPCTRLAFSAIRRTFLKRAWSSGPDPLDHATGLEKRELLSKLTGVEDPYYRYATRTANSRSQPIEVPSAFDSRLVGCKCEEFSVGCIYMWVHKGMPKRCQCGNWFALVSKAPL